VESVHRMLPQRGDSMTTEKPRLLVFEMRMLGDAILSLPFMRSALSKYEVFVCCNPGAEQIFESIVAHDHLISWKAPWLAETGKYRASRWNPEELRVLIRKLKDVRAELAVSVWPDAREHILMALSGTPARLGFPMNRKNYLAHERRWRNRHLIAGQTLTLLAELALLRPLLTTRLDRANYLQQHLEDWHQIADAMKLPWDTSTPWIKAGGHTRNSAVDQFCSAARTRGEQLWMLHPGARLPSKRWPLHRFQELVDSVFTPRGLPLVIINPPDSPCPIPRNSRQLVVKTQTLRDLIDVINAVDLVVCNDSATSHLASALGKRAITLFSSGSPSWFGPFGNNESVVKADACSCSPCMDRCEMPSYVCQDSITVDMVRVAMEKLQRGKAAT